MSSTPHDPLSRSQLLQIFKEHDVGLNPEPALQAAARLARSDAMGSLDAALEVLRDVDDLLISLAAIAPKLTNQPNTKGEDVSVIMVSAAAAFARDLVAGVCGLLEGGKQ